MPQFQGLEVFAEGEILREKGKTQVDLHLFVLYGYPPPQLIGVLVHLVSN